MNFRLKKLIIPAVVILLAMSAIAGKRPGQPTPQDVAKADYMFLEAMSKAADNDYVTYLELISRAHALNPSDTTIGFYSGLLNFIFTASDSVGHQQQYKLMKDYAVANPDDYASAQIFANLAERLSEKDDIILIWNLLHKQYPARPEFTFGYAQALARYDDNGGVEKAISLLDTLEITQGQSLGLSSNKMRLLMGKGDTTAVVNELRRLLKFAPASVENNIFAGDVYKILSMNDTALYYYDRACNLDSTSGEAFYSRAAFYREVGDSARYDSEIFTALNKSSLDVDVKMEILKTYVGEIYQDSLQYERVRDLFDHIIAMHPHQPELHALYARYLMTRGDLSEAAVQQGYAVDINPDHLDEWKLLMTLWAAAGDREKAVQTGRRALRYFPDDKELKIDIGINLCTTDTAKALECFHSVLSELKPDESELEATVYACIGDMYTTKERNDSAIAYYEKSIKLNPDNALILNNLAYVIAEQDGDLDRARSLVEKSLQLSPDNTSALDTYAWVLFKQKEYKLAKIQIDKAIELTPELSEEVLSHAGDIYFMNGLPDEAVDLWQQALDITPDDELLKRKVKHHTYFYK